jgi:Flp pilus assembly pilin Flp
MFGTLREEEMRTFANERGQGLVEYALILLLVVIVLILMVTIFGGQVYALYERLINEWNSAVH